ncbi:MAG TPA: WecB/TagA/CpsF family glycosyltransferase [Candidatus Methanoperedens sp.]|nr:WecB/TagA/CpsF family glycosyltransferase [Candidatus Methanoperedens sp.]
MVGVVGRLRRACELRERLYFSTPNVNFLVASVGDAHFRHSLISSDLLLADGMPLIWMARLLRLPLLERIAGSSLFESLQRAPATHTRVYFFGGQAGAAEAACRKLNAGRGGMSCAGFQDPGFGSVEQISEAAMIRGINESGADLLVVSLGARKGQEWIMRNLSRLTVPAVGNLGAVVNFAAGSVRRSPRWLQRLGLEWLWRIKEEPYLWRRYARDGLGLARLFLTRVVPCAWHQRFTQPSPADLTSATVRSSATERETFLELQGAWVSGNLEPLRDALRLACARGTDIAVALQNVRFVDSAFIGLLILLHAHQENACRRLRFASLSRPVRKALKLHCAEYLHAG